MKEIEIIRSDRKTISVEITRDLRVVVRAPLKMKKADIDKFVKEKKGWIDSHLEKMRLRTVREADAAGDKLTYEDIKRLADDALADLPPRIELWAKRMGVTYGRVTVRNQKTRWGSCTSDGNLNFNCLLMLCPEKVREYVVIHELCHRKYMNHSAEFWSTVSKHCPDYKTQRAWLKENGGALIRRMTEN